MLACCFYPAISSSIKYLGIAAFKINGILSSQGNPGTDRQRLGKTIYVTFSNKTFILVSTCHMAGLGVRTILLKPFLSTKIQVSLGLADKAFFSSKAVISSLGRHLLEQRKGGKLISRCFTRLGESHISDFISVAQSANSGVLRIFFCPFRSSEKYFLLKAKSSVCVVTGPAFIKTES